VSRIAGAIAVSAAAACLIAPAGASATETTTAAQVDPIPECVKVVINNAPGFATSTVGNFVNNGELPRIMGPFLPC
jgi:hypothetical protein